MSYTTLLGWTPEQAPVHLAELSNSRAWALSVWNRMLGARGVDLYGPQYDPALDELWASIETLDECEQAALILTFDTGIIPRSEAIWCADGLAEFENRLPTPENQLSHVKSMEELLRKEWPVEFPFFACWATSIVENPFQPWPDNDDDDYGTIGITQIYPLKRHRHTPEMIRAITEYNTRNSDSE